MKYVPYWTLFQAPHFTIVYVLQQVQVQDPWTGIIIIANFLKKTWTVLIKAQAINIYINIKSLTRRYDFFQISHGALVLQ